MQQSQIMLQCQSVGRAKREPEQPGHWRERNDHDQQQPGRGQAGKLQRFFAYHKLCRAVRFQTYRVRWIEREGFVLRRAQTPS